VRVSGALSVGTWTSLACTVDDSRVALWVNGVVRGSLPITGFKTNSDGPWGLSVGTNIPYMGEDLAPFDGLIDNVRIWRRALAGPEICAAALGCR
jgi:hypothetical protein